MNLKIKVNKKRQLLNLIGVIAICFVLFLVVFKFIRYDGEGSYYYFYLLGFITLFIYVFILMIIAFINLIKFLFNKNAGILINETGIYNNLGIISAGKIQWADISAIKIFQTRRFNIRYLIIELTDNDKYLKNKNFLQKYFLKKNIKRRDSPILIPENSIDYNIDELARVISQHIK